MKKYKVEFRRSYNDDYDNWIGDWVQAESALEAVELARAWLVKNGYDGDIDEVQAAVSAVKGG